jgi:hypothetical protein
MEEINLLLCSQDILVCILCAFTGENSTFCTFQMFKKHLRVHISAYAAFMSDYNSWLIPKQRSMMYCVQHSKLLCSIMYNLYKYVFLFCQKDVVLTCDTDTHDHC